MILAVIAGCGSAQGLQRVTGKVTLDGKPLEGAAVEFQPTAQGGSPSYGVTDAGGAFKLMFTIDKEGAMLGDHTVRISKTEGAKATETLPAKYNMKSTLTATVTAGSNTFDFPLSSEGGTRK
jgi:hypothetical protein